MNATLKTGNSPDISFCVPVYNVENFLSDCINSIIAQETSAFTYEIVCVEDKSTDGTAEVLKELAKKHPQIRVFDNSENRGVSYTRNRAVKNATGKYIWFVDPDDMLYPHTVEKMFIEAEKHNTQVILGNYINCDETAKLQDFTDKYDPSFSVINTDGNNFLPFDDTGKRMCACVCGMFRRDFLLLHNLAFQEKMIAQEDTLFYYEFSLKTDSIIKYNAPCYIYRQRATSVMHSKSAERSKRYYESMRIMHRVYSEHLRTGDYKDKAVLLHKLHHMQQNITVCLALVPDSSYVKQELKDLKKQKIYPYKFRKDALKSKESFLRRTLFYLQPLEPFFWLLHLSGKIKNK
ncbi:MAG: glycosyltransferase family 2 protein [Clostridia bacterium]|nr:glycosyltransferase family 2 protein [Clostridia bacterium]